jgi:hypothetical protein
MTDKNLDEDNSNIIRKLNSTFSGITKQEGLVSAEQIKLAQQIKEKDRAQQELADEIHSSIISLTGFSRSLVNNASGDFNVLNKTIDASTKIMGGLASMLPYVGGALDGLIKGAGEVTKFMISTFAKAYGNFEQLSDTGVITTFRDLKLNSDATGLTFADTTKVMSKYSKELAVFSGSALAGAKRFQNIANNSKLMSEEFQKIGISISDVTDYQLNYINQQTIAGRSQTMTDKQLQEGSKAYIEQLDTLSKLTGKTRKELQDEVNERMKDARYVAAIASLPDKLKNIVNNVLSNVGRLGPGISEALGELVANAGVATSEDAKALRVSLSIGGVGPQFYKDLKAGKYSAEEANKIIIAAMAKYGKSQDSMSLQASSDLRQTRFIVEGKKAGTLSLKQYNGQQDDIAKNRQRVIDTVGDANDSAAKTRRSLYGTTRNIDALATESEVMTKIMGGLASGLDKVTEELYNFIGDEVPEYIKLRREENKKQTEINTMRRDLNKKLGLEAKLKTLDPDSREAAVIKDQLRDIRFNNLSWGKTLEQQIKIAEAEIRQIQTRKAKAEEAALGPTSSGSSDSTAPGASSSSGTSDSPPPEARSGSTGASSSSGTSDSPPPEARSGSTGQTSGPTSNLPGSVDHPSDLGAVARRYESSAAGSMAIGVDSRGGTSYGKYQIASRVGAMKEFLDMLDKLNPEAAKRLRAAGPADSGKNGRFAQEWKKLVGEGALAGAESQFAFEKIYSPALRGLSPDLRKLIEGDRSLQEMLHSSAVQHGPGGARAIFSKIYRPGMSKQDLIKGVYAERRTYLSKLTPRERAGVLNRYVQEQSDVLAMVGTAPTSGPNQQAAATAPTSTVAAAPSGANLGTPRAAVVSGPTTGFPAVLTGNTAVIPANSGSEASALTQQTRSSSSSEAVNTFMMMSRKLDQVLDVSNTNLRNTRNAVNV